MAITKKTPENLVEAARLRAEGFTHKQLSERFGVSQTTIRQWTDPAYYSMHKDCAVRWQKDNAELVNGRMRLRNQKLTREQKDVRNGVQRQRWANDPEVRNRLKVLAKKYRRTAQGWIAGNLRLATLGHANRTCRIFQRFMDAVTGMNEDEFTKRFMGEGEFGHIVPLCAFDLTNPDHVVRACWVDNLQLISRLENQRKGKRIPDGLDVMALPWCGNPEALIQAQHLIARALSAVNRSGISNGD